MKCMNNLFLFSFVLFLLNINFVYAIPSSSIIPFIGPIIAQIILLISGAFFFVLAKFSKNKYLFFGLGLAALIIFIIFLVV